MDTSILRAVCLVPEMPKIIHSLQYLYNMDTSARWTLGSVPLVSVLKRFDCIWKATKLQSLLSWYVVFPPLFLKKGQVNYLNSKGIKAASLDEGQLCKWHLEIHVTSHSSQIVLLWEVGVDVIKWYFSVLPYYHLRSKLTLVWGQTSQKVKIV